ncbi:MFS transporter [Stappia sp. ICDLI1TA098]
MSVSPLLGLLALAVFFVGASEFMISAMLSPLGAAFGVSTAQAAMLVSAYGFAYAAAAPLLGRLSDRVNRERLLVVALLLLAADGLALTLAPHFAAAVVLRVLGGFASAALVPSAFALIAERVGEGKQAAAMGSVMLGMTAGIVLGPVGAGLLTEAFGWRAPFLATAAGCFTLACCAGLLLVRQAGSTCEGQESAPARATVWRACLRGPLLRPLVAKGLWNGAAVAGFLLAGEVLRRRFGLSTGSVGLAIAAFGLGLGVGNLAVGPLGRVLRSNEGTLALASAVAAAAALAFLSGFASLPAAVLLLAIWGAALGVAAPASTAIIAGRAAGLRGTALALSESLNNLAVLTLLPLAALALETGGGARAGLVLGSAAVAGAVLAACDRHLEEENRAAGG